MSPGRLDKNSFVDKPARRALFGVSVSLVSRQFRKELLAPRARSWLLEQPGLPCRQACSSTNNAVRPARFGKACLVLIRPLGRKAGSARLV